MKARPDVGAVGHFHPETATMSTLVEGRPLVPVKNHAALVQRNTCTPRSRAREFS